MLFRTPIVKESTRSGLKKQQDSNSVGNLTVSSVFGYCASDVDTNCNVDNTHQQHNKRDNYYNGLSFLPNGPVNLPFLPNSSSNNLRILHAQSGLLIAATGFSPDVDHILNVAAGRVFSRISVYDAPSFISSSSTSGKSVDPHRLVREDLSSMMIDAAMSEGARPLGIQLLVIGQSALSSKASNNSLEIYTIDPSGGFRSCIGRGSAIGRGAQRVCSSLIMKEEKLNNNNYGWRGALDRAMLAAVDALESTDEDEDVIKRENSKYGAVVVFGKASCNSLNGRVSTASRCASVDSAIVEECYQRCCEHISSKKYAT